MGHSFRVITVLYVLDTFTGTQFGTVIALLLSGVLADELGWEWIFYFFGIIGCIWCIVWIWLCFDSPANHPRISQARD